MRRSSGGLIWILAAGLAAAAPLPITRCQAAPGSPPAAAAPVSPAVTDGAAEERWLRWIVLDELRRCGPGAARRQLAKRLERVALARLACGRLGEMAALSDLVYALRACEALELLEQDAAGRELAGWLLARREISRRLFRAISEVPEPAEALARFRRLHAADAGAVEAYPDLAVAFATVQPLRHYRRQPAPADLLASFRYYTEGNRVFRYDLKTLPYELSRYLADTQLSLAERRWVQQKYGPQRDLSAAYFDVDYDHPHFEQGKPQRMASVPYTLANLSRLGGICLDQAYYASEVCKALGVPAAIVFGRGGAGVSHAWFARLRVARRGRSPEWTSRTGRYQANLYYVGIVKAPASGEKILDSELMLLGSAVRLPLHRREETDAAVELARRVDAARDGPAKADLAPLEQLAKVYRARLAEPAATAAMPRLSTGWIARRRKLDLLLVEDLIAASISRNLAHRPAWQFLLKLRQADRLPADRLNRFFTTLIHKTGQRYPEFSCQMILRIAPTIPDGAHRQRIYERALTVYGRRPDLTGRLLIALGDDCRDRGRKDEALRAYRRAAEQTVQLAEIVVKAARRAETILLASGRRDEAIEMYRRLFARAEPLKLAEFFRAQTSHYQLGLRLAALLEAGGRKQDAKQVLAKIKG